MKKAKNALAIIAIVLGVVAALCVVGIPVLEALLLGKPYNEAMSSIPFEAMKGNVANLFKFGELFADVKANLIPLVTLALGAVGVVLFIVLLVLMICKKHVKGLGWWFPMLIVFALSFLALGGCRLDLAGYAAQTEQLQPILPTLAKAIGFVEIGVLALMILSLIFYMVYVCKARKHQKKVAEAKSAAIARIDALLGGNK